MEASTNPSEQENNSTTEADDGITMVDVLQEEEDLENDAEAVLGAGDDSSCTYSLGYMKRQPLYACLTCCPVLNSSAGGICLGCSYHCHEGHELVELYTKRYFKCDCGTSVFPTSNPCKLLKEKDLTNEENSYNQNFKGKYCSCGRPYPDPEDNVEDSMIQCIICEDWYHGRHTAVDILPNDEDFAEMICHHCVSKLPFLSQYLKNTVSVSTKAEDTTGDVDVEMSPKKHGPRDANSEADNSIIEEAKSEDKDGNDGIQDLNANKGCKLNGEMESILPPKAIFFVDNWRKELCTCSTCKEIYKKLKVFYLTDPEDTVAFYESEGRAKRRAATSVQRELDALSSLDRITRTEVVHEYNNLSTSLRDYLRKFAENGKVVKDEDIREFFSQLTANKRQKTNGMQYFCK